MSIELIDKIKPKNNGSFALVEAHDIQMPDGSRLDTWEGKGTIPYFDLVELGLPDVPVEGGEKVTVQTDATGMIEALFEGAVRFRVNLYYRSLTLKLVFTLHDISSPDGTSYFCSHALDLFGGVPMLLYMLIEAGKVTAGITLLEEDTTPATSIDLSALDTEGKVVETYADGTSKATTLEFDSNGNPVKITDGDGNVTTLIW